MHLPTRRTTVRSVNEFRSRRGRRVAEDDPESDLYAESSDADTVISYIVSHMEL